MTRYERIKAAISHKTADKVPTCIHLADEGLDVYADMLYDKYVDENLRKLCDEGKLSKTHAMYYSIGNHVLAVECPWWDWYDLPEEYFDYDAPSYLPKTIGRGSYQEFIDTVRTLKENTDAYILVTIWGSHFEKAYFARGIENFLADLVCEPEYAKELLDFIIHKNMVMLENIIHTPGIDGILLGSDWGSQRDLLMSPEIWRDLIAPGEKKEYDLIHSAGLDVWVHSCGDIRKIFPDLVEMGIDVLNPIQPECMDIYDLKDKYGDKITFWGGISTQQTLPNGKPADVKAETEQVTAYLAKNGGYIIAPAQEIQEDVPFENLCALIDSANGIV